MALLGEEQRAIHRGWQEKGDWLRQCMDLQLFNREADQIDAATSAHETFLDYNDLGVCLFVMVLACLILIIITLEYVHLVWINFADTNTFIFCCL